MRGRSTYPEEPAEEAKAEHPAVEMTAMIAVVREHMRTGSVYGTSTSASCGRSESGTRGRRGGRRPVEVVFEGVVHLEVVSSGLSGMLG